MFGYRDRLQRLDVLFVGGGRPHVDKIAHIDAQAVAPYDAICTVCGHPLAVTARASAML
jgi:hypothetical protein